MYNPRSDSLPRKHHHSRRISYAALEKVYHSAHSSISAASHSSIPEIKITTSTPPASPYEPFHSPENILDIEKPLPQRQTERISRSAELRLRLGVLSLVILISGPLCIAASLGFLWFLWKSDSRNETWQRLVSHDYAARTVTLSAVVVRSAASFMVCVATSLVAGVALERVAILRQHLASVSLVRNANGGPYLLFWWLIKGCWKGARRGQDLLLLTLIIVLMISTVLLQFTSTVLVSDLSATLIPGDTQTSIIATNLKKNSSENTLPTRPGGTTWLAKAPFYPTFAEYHEEPSSNSGAVETGRSLRALLPLPDATARENLRSYKGRVTVLDTRAVCMPPDLKEIRIDPSTGELRGQLRASANASRLTFTPWRLEHPGPRSGHPEIFAANMVYDWNERPYRNFSCPTAGSFVQTAADIDYWRLIACEISSPPGQLISEFRDLDAIERSHEYTIGERQDGTYGLAYLFINHTIPFFYGWEDGMRLLGTSKNEWAHLGNLTSTTSMLDLSLCFTAFDSADLVVSISGPSNRTESTPVYNAATGSLNFSTVRHQLGQRTSDASDRGILSLAPRSWIPDNGTDHYIGTTSITHAPWLTDFANMAGPQPWLGNAEGQGSHPTKVTTTMLYTSQAGLRSYNSSLLLTADPSLIALVQEILQSSSGSAALAMQSIVTVLSSIAYYDQIAYFNDQQPVVQSAFVLRTAPTRNQGLSAVTAVAFVHVLATLLALVLWARGTHVSSIGNAWQSVAQCVDWGTEELLLEAFHGTDGEIKESIAKSGTGALLVGIQASRDGTRTEVVGKIEQRERRING